MNPRDIKRRLAREIVGIYHGKDAADAADAEWMRVHSQGKLPKDIPNVIIGEEATKEGKVWICRLLVLAGMAKGTGEARRLVEQGAVTLNKILVPVATAEFALTEIEGAVLKVGARRYVRISVQ